MRRTSGFCLLSGLILLVYLSATSPKVRAAPAPKETQCVNCTCVIWQLWVWQLPNDGGRVYGKNLELQGATWVASVNAYPIGYGLSEFWVKDTETGGNCGLTPVPGGAPPGNPPPVAHVQRYESGSIKCDFGHEIYMSGTAFVSPIDDPEAVAWMTCE